MCGSVPHSANSVILSMTGRLAGDTITYGCKPHYVPDHFMSTKLTCMVNGMWDNPAPVCKCKYMYVNEKGDEDFVFTTMLLIRFQ